MNSQLVTDAAEPLTEAFKGMDASHISTNEVQVRYRRNTVVITLTGRLTDEQKKLTWDLFQHEFDEAGWGWRASYGNGFDAPRTAMAFDHPITLTHTR